MMHTGMKNEMSVTVTEELTAEAMGSGTLPVLATPAMILLMERTACESVMTELKDGESTVGISLDVKHTAPSIVGSEVVCMTELIEIDRSRLKFAVRAVCQGREIGRGTHERFIVNNAKFMDSATRSS